MRTRPSSFRASQQCPEAQLLRRHRDEPVEDLSRHTGRALGSESGPRGVAMLSYSASHRDRTDMPLVFGAALTRRRRQALGERRIRQQAKHVRRGRLVIAAFDEQAVLVVGENRGHAAGVRRHDRAPARERLEHRRRHVVDVGRLQIDVGLGVVAPDVFGRDASGEPDVFEPQLAGELAQALVFGPGADQRQRCFRISVLDEPERAQRARDVVERLEIPRREDVRPERSPRSGTGTDPRRRCWG